MHLFPCTSLSHCAIHIRTLFVCLFSIVLFMHNVSIVLPFIVLLLCHVRTLSVCLSPIVLFMYVHSLCVSFLLCYLCTTLALSFFYCATIMLAAYMHTTPVPACARTHTHCRHAHVRARTGETCAHAPLALAEPRCILAEVWLALLGSILHYCLHVP